MNHTKYFSLLSPRWRKVLGDLWSNKLRTSLVVLSIGVGIFAMGTVTSLYIILLNDMNADYHAINPQSVMIGTSGFSDDLLHSISRMEGVKDVEGRTGISARASVAPEKWYTINITAIPPLSEMKINRLRSDSLPKELNDHEILIERSTLPIFPVKQGDAVTVELRDGTKRLLRVADVVHDVSGFPGILLQQVNAYVNLPTAEWLGGGKNFDRVIFTLTEKQGDESHIRAVTKSITDKLEKDGRQIVVMYVILVMGFGLLALLVAVPAAMYMTNDLASGFANFFNFNLATTNGIRYPTESLILQIVLALLTPVLAAFAPVWSGTRVSVREAISEYGLGKGRFGKSRFDRTLERINFFSRPILISIRNTFRRKIRLTITLLTLTLGGAIFLAILNFQGSLAIAIDEALGYLLTDVNVALGQSYRIEKITQIAMSSPDVAKVEAWGELSAQLLSPDKKTNSQVIIFAPPNDSTLIKPVLQEGRWILPDDENAVVMGPQMIIQRPDLKVGDTVILKINDKEYDFRIVGLYKLLGNVEPPVLYANSDYVSRIGGYVGRSPSFRIATHKHDDATQERVAKEIETKLKDSGVQVQQVITGSYIVNVNNSINAYFVFFAMIMAVLSAVVGGLGLMGTMSMNVIERTREIGVMRALGASDLDVLKLVITEGMMIGIFSWALGTLVGLPITYFFDVVIGYAFVRAPMPFVFSVWGCVVWLIFVVIIAAIASAIPAWNASRLTVRDVLAYE
ncbi:MAG: FtsX-like permease family protein [Chloroflexi bacterium]|nr:FtsX-like permease family protein [Chloroflexota bacterium]